MERERHESVDIAKGLGILLVIGGHCGFEIPHMPAYSFHMPLFYFISGFFLYKYLYIETFNANKFVIKKFNGLLVPYMIYNFLYGIITYLLHYIDIKFSSSNFHSIINIHNLFIEPFLSGHQFQISCPLWFVPSLFLVLMIFCITNKLLQLMVKNYITQIILILLLTVVYYCSIHTTYSENKYLAVLLRTIIGYVFCIFGMLYYINRNKFNYTILLFISICIYGYFAMKFGIKGYSLLSNDFGSASSPSNKYSLLIILSGIFIIISISNIISKYRKFVNPEDLSFLGKNSFHIMAFHLSAFLILNIIISIGLPHKYITDITGIYFRYPHINWVYFFFSVFLSYYYLKIIDHCKKKYYSLSQ